MRCVGVGIPQAQAADLTDECMGAQDVGLLALAGNVGPLRIGREEKGVLGITGGMILGRVEGIEAEPFGFHLGRLGHGEPDLLRKMETILRRASW